MDKLTEGEREREKKKAIRMLKSMRKGGVVHSVLEGGWFDPYRKTTVYFLFLPSFLSFETQKD